MPMSPCEGDGFHITSLDREDDHGEEGKDEEADRKRKGRSGAQEEKGAKATAKKSDQEGG
jgi:hypothetical protein